MATQKPLVIGSGTTAQFPSVAGDSLEIGGAVLAKNTTDSVTAFRVQNAAGTVTVLDVDTTNARVGIGTAAPTASLSVGSSGTERFRVDGATGRIVEYSDGVPANGEVLIGDGTNFVKNTLTAGTNIAVTNGAGTVSLGLTGTVGVANGGTGTSTAFTTGSVVFAGASGVYAQDNDNLFWDDTNNRLGIGFVPVVTFSGVLTLGGTTISLTTTAVCTVDASFDLLVPAGTVVIDVDTAGSVIARYGTGVTGNTLATNLQATTAILTATAIAGGLSILPSGFYTTTTVASSSRTLSSTLNVGTTGQFRVSSIGDIVAIRGQTTTFPASNASGVLTNNGSGTLSWAAAGVGGSGVAAQLAYFTSTSAIGSETGVGTNALTWDATNNRLGVGTNVPTTTVDVASGQVAIPDGTAAAPAIAFRDDLNNGVFSPATDIFGIAVNGTEVARFQQSGAGNTPVMLLGTSTVYGAITVDSSDASGTAGVVMLGHAAAGTVIQESYKGGQFAGVRSRGTKGAPTAVASGDGLVNMLGAGWTATGGINYGGLVTVKAEEAYTSTASGGRIEFHTTTLGTDGFTTLGSATTERMRITNAGRVGIGTSTPGASLEVANSDALVYGLTVGRGSGAVSSNTALGASALAANTASGTANTAVGGSALAANTAGDQLTAVGFNALTAVTGTANTAVGAGCGQSITSGVSNTGVGAFALSGFSAATTGGNNTALGYIALSNNTASQNTAVGSVALAANTSGTGHVAVGYNALAVVTTAADCTAVGHSALASATGASNTAVGARAGDALTTGTSNVAIGADALGANQTGAGSVAIGDSALALATGSGNVGIGLGAGTAITVGVANVAVGRLALFTADIANSNTAIGDSALRLATGANNTAVGSGAIDSLTTGTGNIGIGVGVLTAATTGVDNVAVGNSALASLVSGGENVSVGTLALATNTASSNTAVGNQAAQLNTSGTLLVAVGASALKANTTAADSTAVGANALASSQGAQNTALGSSAGSTVTAGTNVTLVGYNAQPTLATTSNEITLGNSSVTILRCAVNTITLISDQRDKAEIQDLSLGLDFLKTVHPVQFKWDRREWYKDGVSDGSKKQDFFEPGFIAQELDAAQTAATAEWLGLALKENPDRWEATPLRLFPVVVKACQALAAQAAAATARAIEAERRLDALEAALAALQTS